MGKEKQFIQIKCVIKCTKCNKEEGILSAFTYDREIFPNLSYKEFFSIADNDYDKFENIVKENLSTICNECSEETKIIEILDMKYI